MNPASLLVGLILSTLYGAAFHLIRGGGFWRLLLYILLGWIGFWVGHGLAIRFGLTFANLGPLNLGMATLTSLVVLLAGSWLSHLPQYRS